MRAYAVGGDTISCDRHGVSAATASSTGAASSLVRSAGSQSGSVSASDYGFAEHANDSAIMT